MRNIKLLIEYDGTDYVGWQRQLNGKSIQGEIERVLCEVLQEKVDVIGAGRTDSGVHARGQVANFHTSSHLGTEEIHRALNGLLPEDIVVHHAEEVPLDFHARYSARERTYSYRINTVPTALMRRCSWWVKYSLNVDLMDQAGAAVVGMHDFKSFCKAEADVNNHICTVVLSKWSRDGATLRYEITANRFLHGMVRSLVGTMVDVGRGYTTMQEFLQILEAKDRREAGMAASARGLVLESILF
jgi:tRNA pseudouridine38-40 synthase